MKGKRWQQPPRSPHHPQDGHQSPEQPKQCNVLIWEMLKKRYRKNLSTQCWQVDVDIRDVEQRDDKNLRRTRAVLGGFLPQLVPSCRSGIPLWIAHFVLAYFFFRSFLGGGWVDTEPSNLLFSICKWFKMYLCHVHKVFLSFLLEFLLYNICCVSKLIGHFQKSYTHFLLLIVVWVVLMAVQPYMLGICVGGTAVENL